MLIAKGVQLGPRQQHLDSTPTSISLTKTDCYSGHTVCLRVILHHPIQQFPSVEQYVLMTQTVEREKHLAVQHRQDDAVRQVPRLGHIRALLSRHRPAPAGTKLTKFSTQLLVNFAIVGSLSDTTICLM